MNIKVIEQVRNILQQFQDGYTERDLDQKEDGQWRFHTIHWSMPVD